MFLSVIIPAYNSGKFIGKAIESVVNQTYKEWELIVVDDCSIDNTSEIVALWQKKDHRIHYEKLDKNTGSAFIPRKRAAEISKGDYVVLLDSDDYLDIDFLARCFVEISKTGADTVLGKMIILNDKEEFTGITIPQNDFDEKQQLSGKEALRLTVPWKIGLNGAAFNRRLFLDTYCNHVGINQGVYGDELLCRYCLLASNLVVFTGAYYFYRSNTESLVHSFSPRLFHMYDTYRDVRRLFISQFGVNTCEHLNAEMYMLGGFRHALDIFLNNRDGLGHQERKAYLHRFKDWYADINWKKIKPVLSVKQKLVEVNGFKVLYYLYLIKKILKK